MVVWKFMMMIFKCQKILLNGLAQQTVIEAFNLLFSGISLCEADGF